MSTSPEVLLAGGRAAGAVAPQARPAPWRAAGPVPADASHGAGRAAGYAAGYAAGWATGAAAAAERAQVALDAELARLRAERDHDHAQVRSALAALRAAAADLEAREAPVVADCTDALARTGLDLAAAVVGAEVRGGAGARAALLRAVAPCPPTGALAVRLHPADLVEVRSAGEVPERVELVADPSLARGDAVAEHPGGSVDARLSAALERARDVLVGGAA